MPGEVGLDVSGFGPDFEAVTYIWEPTGLLEKVWQGQATSGEMGPLRGVLKMSPEASGGHSFCFDLFSGQQSKCAQSSVSSRQLLSVCLRLSVTLSVWLSACLSRFGADRIFLSKE